MEEGPRASLYSAQVATLQKSTGVTGSSAQNDKQLPTKLKHRAQQSAYSPYHIAVSRWFASHLTPQYGADGGIDQPVLSYIGNMAYCQVHHIRLQYTAVQQWCC